MQMPPLPPCGNSHKKLMTPKRIRRKLKNLKFQNTKIENPQSSQVEKQIPLSPFVKVHRKN
jgi:hypothetical protein